MKQFCLSLATGAWLGTLLAYAFGVEPNAWTWIWVGLTNTAALAAVIWGKD